MKNLIRTLQENSSKGMANFIFLDFEKETIALRFKL
jgi:hypothetical protein